jgi:hypothetical protein
MKNIKVGDKVRVYGFCPNDASRIMTRTIVQTNVGRFGVLLETDTGEWVHPKQCRRLVRKKRREWTLYSTSANTYATGPDVAIGERITVREVKK